MPKYKNILNVSKRTFKRRFDNHIPQPRENVFSMSSHTYSGESSSVFEGLNIIDSDNEDTLSEIEDFDTKENIDILDFLRNWVFKFNVNHNAVNELLTFLKANAWSHLPKDSRTLLHTPKHREVMLIDPGKYVHMGLKSGLDKILEHELNYPEILHLDFNIDTF